MRKLIRSRFIIICLLAANLTVFAGLIHLGKQMASLVSILQTKLDIYEQQRTEDILDLNKNLRDVAKTAFENDELQLKQNKNLLELSELITNNVEFLKEKVEALNRNLSKYQRINIPNIENIKKANISIYNSTTGFGASGTHIKVGNESYILTCYHILDKIDDNILIMLDNKRIYVASLIKFDKQKDLALFEIKTIPEDYPYLEISKEEPRQGSKIYVIGNPADMNDTITEGIIVKIKRKKYIFTNKVFYGNSGGAVLYKGKIIGVMNRLQIYFHLMVVENYGGSCNLTVLREFLGEM